MKLYINGIKDRTKVIKQDEIIYVDVETQMNYCETDRARITCTVEDYKRVCADETSTLEECKSYEAFLESCNESKKDGNPVYIFR